MVQNDFEPEPLWLLAVRMMAKGVAERGCHLEPDIGIDILEDWLPVAAFWPEMEAWFRRDIAEYLTIKGDFASATVLCEQACRIAENQCSLDEVYHCRFDFAHVLLKAGKPKEALALLRSEIDDSRVPYQQVRETLLRAEISYSLDDPDSAQEWIDHAGRIIDTYDLWRLKPEIEAVLARRT